MFTNDDLAFLARLGARAQVRLSASDSSSDRLLAAIGYLREVLVAHPDLDPARRVEVENLLDGVWWASSAGERHRARGFAAQLTRVVRRLDLQDLRAMRVVDAAQQIRTLVVLAA